MKRRTWKQYIAGLIVGSMIASISLGTLAEEIPETLPVAQETTELEQTLTTESEAESEPESSEEVMSEAEESSSEEVTTEAEIEESSSEELTTEAESEPVSSEEVTSEAETEEASSEELTTEAESEPASSEEVTSEAETEEASSEELITEAESEPETSGEVTSEAETEEASSEEMTTEAESEPESIEEATTEAESEEVVTEEVQEEQESDPIAWGLSHDNLELEQGEIREIQLYAMMTLSNRNESPSLPVWESSDESVVKVEQDGILTAVAPGTAVISVNYNGEIKTCIVVVKAAAGFTVSMSSSMGTISAYTVGNTNYLFLPNTAQADRLQINYTGVINKTSVGTIDPTAKTITADWDGKSISFALTLGNGQTKNLVVMASRIPCMHIQLNGTTLEKIHQDKDVKYKGNTVIVSDIFNAENNLNKSDVEMKGRGNSSWQFFDKKGYQIKFDKKTSVLGMDPAKKWCLIANANDGTMLRNKLAYELAANGCFAYTVEGEYVDLWVDGVYLGVYLVTEKVEIGSTRLALEDPKGVLVELDNAFYATEDVYFRSNVSGMYYVQKEVVDEDTTAGIQSFQAAMETLESHIQNESAWSVISSLMDAQSFAEFYLVNEMLLNKECLCTSFYLYKDGDADVIHAGPVWDFDTCLDANGSVSSEYFLANNGMPFSTQSDMFRQLCQYQEFVKLIEDTYDNKYKALYPEMITLIDTLYDNLKDSAEMNYTRWDVLGTTDDKGGKMFDTYLENIIHLKDWLLERINQFIPLNLSSVLSHRTGSTALRTLTVKDANNQLSSIRVAVWSIDGGQNDLVWYPGIKIGTEWKMQFDLSSHRSTGQFILHIYGVENGVSRIIGTNLLTYSGGGQTVVTGDYALVFDAVYYSNRYPDLKAAFGTNQSALLQHFKTHGMKEGRQANPQFNVSIYQANYEELQKMFGNNLEAYYQHYMSQGYKEGRNASVLLNSQKPSEKPDEEVPNEKPDGNDTNVETNSFVYNGVDYKLVFDLEYYLNKYADLKAAFKTDKLQALKHFVVHGMKEGRQASKNFDLAVYRANYADLRKAFGNNNVSYYMHYIEHGYKEHRIASTQQAEGENNKPELPENPKPENPKPENPKPENPKPENPESSTPIMPGNGTFVYNGVDYTLVFDASYYLNKYADLKAAFGNNKAAAFQHFIANGMREGRQAKATFNVYAYRKRYVDLQRAFGSNLPAYYLHYIQNGHAEKRNAK